VALAMGLGGPALGLVIFLITRRRSFFIAAVLMFPVVGAAALQLPSVQNRVLTVLRGTATTHIGNVHTAGHGYKLLDQRFYSGDPIASMTVPEASRYVVRALVSFGVTPTPWQISSASELAFLPQQMIWYVLIICAGRGLLPGLRRDPVMTCLLCGYVAIGAAGISLASGNVGTFVRHKDIVTPFMVWLSVLGLESFIADFVNAPTAPSGWRQRWRTEEAACV
jgi:hypothetical protein